MKITFTLNGKKTSVDVPPMMRLLDLLREKCEMTGTKEGCGEGECGACSILLNNEMVNSCLVPAAQVHGAKVTTIEGLTKDKLGKRVQSSFVECGGAQCGICTPGMIVATCSLLTKTKRPSEAAIAAGLAGNLCRCTGYMRIFDAVKKAAHK